MSVGRDGASDAVSFLKAGVPAVEFGPSGARPPRARGVGLDRLAGALPAALVRLRAQRARRASRADAAELRAVEGGLA